MVKRSKIIYIVGSLLIGVVSLLAVLFALIAGGGVGGVQTKLVFESESAEKVYDGTPLTCVKWKLTSGELKKGYEIKATVTGTQTDAGTGENFFSVSLVNESGEELKSGRFVQHAPAGPDIPSMVQAQSALLAQFGAVLGQMIP